MYYYIYKTTNIVNQKYYIGRRESRVPPSDDSYLGSGKRLKAAIKKYGKQSFIKEVLEMVDDHETLVEREKKIVDEQLVNDRNCYNLAIGGHGGYTSYSERTFHHTDETKAKISKANSGRKRPDVRDRSINNQYAKGLVRTDEDKAKKAAAAIRRLERDSTDFNTIITCPHCNKEGQAANMRRWHFDNCKRRTE